ncbi:MAG: caspase family protein [Verrucomicrobiota bacterium]
MKILFIHGIGFHEGSEQLLTWVPQWVHAITAAAADHAGLTLSVTDPFGPDALPAGPDGKSADDPGVLYYEKLIGDHDKPDGFAYLSAVASLSASLLATKITDAVGAVADRIGNAFGNLFTRDRGLLDSLVPQELQWKAREVAAWAVDDDLRKKLRNRIAGEITAKDPEVVIAHSFGGLLLYDTCLFLDPDLLRNRHLITLGTQVGNPLLRREFNGFQRPLKCRHWFNLYNPHDKVFVSSLAHIRGENFTQIVTAHHVGSGHDGAAYLGHSDFAALVWPRIHNDLAAATPGTAVRTLSLAPPPPRPLVPLAVTRKPVNRALLIGIDRYTHPAIPTLHGCANDTFQLSATLQEAGIDHRDIRLIHNEHAIRASLLHHIRWLLEDSEEGDHRILGFSGHGHRRPAYDPQSGAPLEMHEILCTHDYDPSEPDTGLRDADFQDLYANLPRGVHFTIFLDCCHSGGITRSGGPAIRSFTGPADIQHESSKWNADLEMWEQGPLLKKSLNAEFIEPGHESKKLNELWRKLDLIHSNPPMSHAQLEEKLKATPNPQSAEELHRREHALYYGSYGDTRRLGRATPLRDLRYKDYDENAATLKVNYPKEPTGPYLPLVFMACGETEQASEYVHGAVSYGAFTYALTLTLRQIRKTTPRLSYGELLIETARKLRTLGYTQTPDVLGPPDQLSAKTPFGAPPAPAPAPPASSAKSAPSVKSAKSAAKKAPAKKAARKKSRK